MSTNDDASIQGRGDALDNNELMSAVRDDGDTALELVTATTAANDESATTPPPLIATDTSVAILLGDISSSASAALPSPIISAAEEVPSLRRRFARLRSFSLHLPNGELVDCKNTVQSHSLLHYSNNADGDSLIVTPDNCHTDGLLVNHDSHENHRETAVLTTSGLHAHLLQGIASFQNSMLGSWIIPADTKINDTSMDDSDDDDIGGAASSNDYDHTEVGTLGYPVAIPLMDHVADVANVVAMDPSVPPPPRIHYLMVEPTEAEQDRLLSQASDAVSRQHSGTSLPSWMPPWIRNRKRLAGSSLAAILALLVWVTVWLFAPSDDVASRRRAVAIEKLINDITLSKTKVTLVHSYFGSGPLSIEQRALWWLAHEDPLQLNPVHDHTYSDGSSFKFRLGQRYALATLWLQQPPSHPNYLDVARHECDWSGISCGAVLLSGNVDSERAVLNISLPELKWIGKIVPDLGLLSTLVHFDLHDGSLTGSLPSSIGAWSGLMYFNVQDNDLTGSLPASIGRWTVLKFFNVGDNHLAGTLPKSIGRWTHMQHFVVSHQRNTFSKFDDAFPIPGLVGSLPDSASQWSALKYFDVRENRLVGTLPFFAGKMDDDKILPRFKQHV